MPSPKGKELLFIGGALLWGLAIGPALMALAIYTGISRSYAAWIAGAYFGTTLLLGGIGLGMYFTRIAREMGAGGVAITVIWILITLVLAALARSAFQSILKGF